MTLFLFTLCSPHTQKVLFYLFLPVYKINIHSDFQHGIPSIFHVSKLFNSRNRMKIQTGMAIIISNGGVVAEESNLQREQIFLWFTYPPIWPFTLIFCQFSHSWCWSSRCRNKSLNDVGSFLRTWVIGGVNLQILKRW